MTRSYRVENMDSFTLKCVIKRRTTSALQSSVSTSVSYLRVQCLNLGIYYVACSFGMENMGNFTFKCAIKKCFNISVYYVACSYCVENMDNFTFESAISYCAEYMDNSTIKERFKVPAPGRKQHEVL